MKGILFNTEMVQAILGGRKTQTRRIVKPQPEQDYPIGFVSCSTDSSHEGKFCWGKDKLGGICSYAKPPYIPGDILYVRETFCVLHKLDEDDLPIDGTKKYYYRADNPDPFDYYVYGAEETDTPKWKPSIHMPKEAARIFLRVTDVRVEKIQDITTEDMSAEGIGLLGRNAKLAYFSSMWDNLYKKGYDWNNNPWVWVIEFERCEKPDEN